MPKFISFLDKKLIINELQKYFCQFSFGGTDENHKLFLWSSCLGIFFQGWWCFVSHMYKRIRLVQQCLLEETRIIPVGAVPNNSRGLQWDHFVHHIAAPSEGNKHVHLPTSYLCQRQCLQRKTGHSLWPPCNAQWLLGAIHDNIISLHGTWFSAELSAGVCHTGRSEFPISPSPAQLCRITSWDFLQRWLC